MTSSVCPRREQHPDFELPEGREAEGDALGPLNQVVHRLGRSVGHQSGMPGDDLAVEIDHRLRRLPTVRSVGTEKI